MFYGLHFTSDTGEALQVMLNTNGLKLYARATTGGGWGQWRRLDQEKNDTSSTVEKAQSAGRWTSPMTLHFGGDVSGSVTFDGSQDVTARLIVTSDSGGEIIKAQAAEKADRWSNPVTMSFSKDVSGSVTFDGSRNVNAELTINPDLIGINASTVEQLVRDSIQEEIRSSITNSRGLIRTAIKKGVAAGSVDNSTNLL